MVAQPRDAAGGYDTSRHPTAYEQDLNRTNLGSAAYTAGPPMLTVNPKVPAASPHVTCKLSGKLQPKMATGKERLMTTSAGQVQLTAPFILLDGAVTLFKLYHILYQPPMAW